MLYSYMMLGSCLKKGPQPIPSPFGPLGGDATLLKGPPKYAARGLQFAKVPGLPQDHGLRGSAGEMMMH